MNEIWKDSKYPVKLMEGNFGSLSFQHGSRPDYPVDDKKANSENLPITRISKCAGKGESNTAYSLGASQHLHVKKVYKKVWQ